MKRVYGFKSVTTLTWSNEYSSDVCVLSLLECLQHILVSPHMSHQSLCDHSLVSSVQMTHVQFV